MPVGSIRRIVSSNPCSVYVQSRRWLTLAPTQKLETLLKSSNSSNQIAWGLSIECRERLFNFSFLAMRQDGFHSLKDGLVIEFLHATDVIRTSRMPMTKRRFMMAEQAWHLAEQANR